MSLVIVATCEDGRDEILSVCQSNPDGNVRHEIIIQRGPREFDFLIDDPGPKISCADLGLDLEPGPESIRFSGDLMTITVAGHEEIQVDVSALDAASKKALRRVAKRIFELLAGGVRGAEKPPLQLRIILSM